MCCYAQYKRLVRFCGLTPINIIKIEKTHSVILFFHYFIVYLHQTLL